MYVWTVRWERRRRRVLFVSFLENKKPRKPLQTPANPKTLPRRNRSCDGLAMDGGDVPLSVRVALAGLLLCVASAASAFKQRRMQQPSRFHEFYSRMRDDEFRQTFRVPRPLFDVIVADLRPHLEYRCSSSPSSPCCRAPTIQSMSPVWWLCDVCTASRLPSPM